MTDLFSLSAVGGELQVITLTVPMPDNIANSRMHWTRRMRIKQQYAKQLNELQSIGIIPPPPAVPLPHVTVRSVMYLGGPMDDDNAVARHKPLLDWLKRAKYIVDDRRKCLRWEKFPEQVVRRNHQYRIEITITETLG